MKLALNHGLSGAASLSGDLDRLLEAERLGYDSVWTSESYGSDAVTTATWMAARTQRIHVGTAIMQMAGRTPAATAMTAMPTWMRCVRAVPARARRVRPAGGRGLARPALRQAATQDARVRRDRARDPPAREATRVQRRV